VTSVFQLRNNRTLSYREHLSHSAAKLKSRNNLITKLVTEYCCPVWATSSYTNLIATQLHHSTVRLISGCLQPTQLSWLPQCSAMWHILLCVVKWQLTILLQIIEAHSNWPVYADVWASTSTACISTPNMVRHHICWQSCSGEDWSLASMVSHTTVTDPTTQQPAFDLPHHTSSLMNRFRIGQGPCRANLHKWGLVQSPSCDCWPINKIWRWTESTPLCGWWRSQMAVIYSDCSTRKITIVQGA